MQIPMVSASLCQYLRLPMRLSMLAWKVLILKWHAFFMESKLTLFLLVCYITRELYACKDIHIVENCKPNN